MKQPLLYCSWIAVEVSCFQICLSKAEAFKVKSNGILIHWKKTAYIVIYSYIVYIVILQRVAPVTIMSREATAYVRETDETSLFVVKQESPYYFYPRPTPGREEEDWEPERGPERPQGRGDGVLFQGRSPRVWVIGSDYSLLRMGRLHIVIPSRITFNSGL